MSVFRGTGALTRALLLETWRAKPTIFWNLVFPLLVLLLFCSVFGAGEPSAVARVVPGVMTVNLLAASFFGVSLHMVSLRERELYRRFSVTPLQASAVVGAHAATAFLNILASFWLQLALARMVFRIPIGGSAGGLVLASLVGAFAFVPLGLLVGSVARDMRSAPAVSNLIFFPLSFLSGATLPLAFMPGWTRAVARALPSTYFVELLQAALWRGDAWRRAGGAVAVLVLTGLVAFALNALLFRWETSRPLGRGRLAAAAGALGLVYGGAVLARVGTGGLPAPAGGGPAPSRPGTHVLSGMTVIDGSGERIERAQITMQGGRIVSVGPLGDAPAGVPVTDLSGAYVIPGLVESHSHLGGSAGSSSLTEEFVPSRLRHDLQSYLAFGVTSLVSMTDHVEDMQKLQRHVAAGVMRSPRVFLSGPGLTAVGGHPAKLFSFLPGFPEYMTRQVPTEPAAAQAVRELGRMGVDLVKLFLDEGWPGDRLPVLPEPALRAAIRTARELGLKTTVHVDNDRHAGEAIRAGAHGIEHVPPDLSDETARLMAERGVTVTPTLAAAEALARLMAGAPQPDAETRRWVEPVVLESLASDGSWLGRVRASADTAAYVRSRYERSRGALRRLVSGNVPVIAGSDAGNAGVFHGPGLIRELELLVEEGGMRPAAALVAATGAAADRLRTKDVGRIAPGAFADLVVLERDPEEDIHALRTVRAVYLGGARLDRETLLTSNAGDWTPTFSFPVPDDDDEAKPDAAAPR